jgi:hypothetical protein
MSHFEVWRIDTVSKENTVFLFRTEDVIMSSESLSQEINALHI